MGFAGVARESSTKFSAALSMRWVDTGKKSLELVFLIPSLA